MSPLVADVIGLAGTALFIAAFGYANVAKRLDKVWFNLANLIGAILLLISLSVSFNLAAFVLEVAWGIIAAVGLVLAIRAKRSPSRLREGPGVGQGDITGPRPTPGSGRGQAPPASGSGDA